MADCTVTAYVTVLVQVPQPQGPTSSSLHFGFAIEEASELGLQVDFKFLHHFPDRGTITSSLFADDMKFLGAFSPASTSCPLAQRGNNPLYCNVSR